MSEAPARAPGRPDEVRPPYAIAGRHGPPPAAVDVYDLPASGLDTHHPIWWGNTILLAVESTMVTLLVVSYFYLRRNETVWPPGGFAHGQALATRLPDLRAATADLLLVLASLAPAIWMDRAARRHVRAAERSEEAEETHESGEFMAPPAESRRFVAALLAIGLVTLGALVLRGFELKGLGVRWSESAYGSITWSLLGIHVTYLLLSACEVFLLAAWVARKGLSDKFAMDATLAAISWYWTIAVWVLVYVVVFWSPRLS